MKKILLKMIMSAALVNSTAFCNFNLLSEYQKHNLKNKGFLIKKHDTLEISKKYENNRKIYFYYAKDDFQAELKEEGLSRHFGMRICEKTDSPIFFNTYNRYCLLEQGHPKHIPAMPWTEKRKDFLYKELLFFKNTVKKSKNSK